MRLNDLCVAGFVEEHVPWGRNKGEYYKLIDEFCLFYLHWVYPARNKHFVPNYWITQTQKPAFCAWAGLAFEAVCSKHINTSIEALQIKNTETISAWRYIPRKHFDTGAQIDLVIDREEKVSGLSLCQPRISRA